MLVTGQIDLPIILGNKTPEEVLKEIQQIRGNFTGKIRPDRSHQTLPFNFKPYLLRKYVEKVVPPEKKVPPTNVWSTWINSELYMINQVFVPRLGLEVKCTHKFIWHLICEEYPELLKGVGACRAWYVVPNLYDKLYPIT